MNEPIDRQSSSWIVSSVGLVAMLFGAGAAPGGTVAKVFSAKTGARLNLRSEPARERNVIRVLPRDDSVGVLPDPPHSGFYKVRTSDRTEGWAHGDFLLLPESVESQPEAAESIARAALNRPRYPLCGRERRYRWAAKTTTTGLGRRSATASVTTVLGWPGLSFHGTSLESWCAPRTSKEEQVYTIDGFVRRVRNEVDGDVHIEITQNAGDDAGECMVVEIPPAALSPRFRAARNDLASLLGAAKINDTDPSPAIHVKVEGLAFWDGWHVVGTLPAGHGRCNATVGAAWELHPMFKIRSSRSISTSHTTALVQRIGEPPSLHLSPWSRRMEVSDACHDSKDSPASCCRPKRVPVGKASRQGRRDRRRRTRARSSAHPRTGSQVPRR